MAKRESKMALWPVLAGVIVPLLAALIGLVPWYFDGRDDGVSRSLGERGKVNQGGTDAAGRPEPPVPAAGPDDERAAAEGTRRENRGGLSEPAPRASPVRQGDRSLTLARSDGSKYMAFARATLSVAFRSVAGERLATLTVTPVGGEPITKPVLGAGIQVSFSGIAGEFRLTVTELDLQNRLLRVLVEET